MEGHNMTPSETMGHYVGNEPFIPEDVVKFLDRELRELGIPWNKVWFCEPLTMEAAKQFVADLRKEWVVV
jgi:hypothetical protein